MGSKIYIRSNPKSFMTKCDICESKLEELFLEKVKGTIVRKPGSSKQYTVCFACQKKFRTKEELLKQIK